MNTIADPLSLYAIDLQCQHLGNERALALVQNGMVISTFPGTQWVAALDLARVLCRALTQPVDLFRIRTSVAEGVTAGDVAEVEDPAWSRLALVRPSLLSGIEVEICDPEIVSRIHV